MLAPPPFLFWGDAYHDSTGDPQQDLSFDERDNAAFAPLSFVVDTRGKVNYSHDD